MAAKVYRDYDQEALDAAYNARATVDFDATIAMWEAEASAARKALDCDRDKSFGSSDMEVLDVFPAGSKGGPMHLFHSWRLLARADQGKQHSFRPGRSGRRARTVAAQFYTCAVKSR